MKLLKRIFIIITVLFLIAAIMVFALYHRPTRWSLDSSTSISNALTPEQRAKLSEQIQHVVLISIDTCRADHLSCYNYSFNTSPNIDAVAEEGLLFNHAIAPVPLTLPGHSSMLTGTIPPYHKVRDNDNYMLGSHNVTLAEILKDNGFSTGAVIGSFVLDSQFGLAQGFDTYDDNLQGKGMNTEVFYNERHAPDVTKLGNAWLDKHKDQKTFLFLHYYDPHAPYVPHNRPIFPSQKHFYDDEIRYTDLHIGKVIDKLKELEMYESTLLIITSDHGESLKQHSETSHGFFIYHSTLHVPLIIRIPKGPKGFINETVGTIDIVPTVCGLLGITPPAHIQGKDLSGYCQKDYSVNNENRSYYCESLTPAKFDVNPLFGLVTDNWKYIHSSEPELFNLSDDVNESNNVFENEKEQSQVMQNELKLLIENDLFNTTTVSQSMIDEATRQRLQSLGYVSGDTTNAEITFEQNSQSPKNIIDVYNYWEKTLSYIADKKYEKAKKLCYEMLKKWPEMKQVYFSLGTIAVFEQDVEGVIKHYSLYLEDEQSKNDNEDIERNPEYALAYSNLGAAFGRKGDLDKAKESYEKALLYNPHYLKANYNLAGVYFRQGAIEKAIEYLQNALQIDPEMPEANRIMGEIRLKQKRYDEAIEYYEAVLKVWPENESVMKSLNSAKELLSKNMSLLEASLERNPNQPQLHNQLSVLYWQKGDITGAVDHWKQSIELDSEQPHILNNLAWILSVYPNESFYMPQQALEYAKQACALSEYSQLEYIDTLSICYAATGNFDKAVETAKMGLGLAEGKQQNTEQIHDRIKLFEEGKVYYETISN